MRWMYFEMAAGSSRRTRNGCGLECSCSNTNEFVSSNQLASATTTSMISCKPPLGMEDVIVFFLLKCGLEIFFAFVFLFLGRCALQLKFVNKKNKNVLKALHHP